MSQVSAGTSNNSFHFPLISDKGLAEEKLKDFILIYNESYPDDLKKILENEQQKNLLLSIFSNSPYLTSLFFKYSDFSIRLFKKTPDDLIEEIYSELKEKQFLNQNELTHSLRIAKAKTALTIAFADLSGHWPLDKITRNLSTFAELCLNLSVNFMI